MAFCPTYMTSLHYFLIHTKSIYIVYIEWGVSEIVRRRLANRGDDHLQTHLRGGAVEQTTSPPPHTHTGGGRSHTPLSCASGRQSATPPHEHVKHEEAFCTRTP